MRRGAVADLLPVLSVEEGHFVTSDGRVGCALACTGINLSIASAAGAAAIADRFAQVLSFLPLDAHLQLLALNDSLRGDDWVPLHLARYRPPPGLEGYVSLLDAAYRRELGGGHVPHLRYYAALSLPGSPVPRSRRGIGRPRGRVLLREREAHAAAVASLAAAASELAHALAEVGITATPVGRQGVLDLLWRCANPQWGAEVAAPVQAASPADLRTLRERLGQSRVVRRADHLRLDGGCEATLALRALPDATFPGWLMALMVTGVTFRFAVHLTPLSKARERTAIARTLRQRHAVLAERTRQGASPDIEGEQTRPHDAPHILALTTPESYTPPLDIMRVRWRGGDGQTTADRGDRRLAATRPARRLSRATHLRDHPSRRPLRSLARRTRPADRDAAAHPRAPIHSLH